VSARRASRLLKLCWKLEELDDVSEIVSLIRIEQWLARDKRAGLGV